MRIANPYGISTPNFFLGATGLLLGLGALTRYAFGWLIIPVLIYFAVFFRLRRVKLLWLILGRFLVVLSPRVARNLFVSRTPFGTAGYAVLENSSLFPENKLQRSLAPDFKALDLKPLLFKLSGNSREILQNDLPKLGGSWVAAFFLVGLLLSYRSRALSRLRYFLVGTLLLLIVIQALGRTQNAQSEFFAIHDFLKPVRALYLTPQTMDSRFLSQWVRSGEHSWPSFILESLLRSYIPGSFPLRSAPQGFFPEQLFLTDDDRWSASNSGEPTSGP